MSNVWQPHDLYTEERQRDLENSQPLSGKLTLIYWGGALLVSLGAYGLLYWLYRIIR